MKTKEEVLVDLQNTLERLQKGVPLNRRRWIQAKLETLADILEEDVPEELLKEIDAALDL